MGSSIFVDSVAATQPLTTTNTAIGMVIVAVMVLLVVAFVGGALIKRIADQDGG